MRIKSTRTDRPYGVIPHDMIRDESLTSNARFLLALMMSYADNWGFSVSHLRKKAGFGRDRMRAATTELERRGYLIRGSIRDRITGTLCGTQWVVVDDPENYAERLAAGDDFSTASGLPEGVVFDPAERVEIDAESTAAAPDYAIDLSGARAAAMTAETDGGDEKTAKSPTNNRGPENPPLGVELPRKRLEIVDSGNRGPENPAVGGSAPIRRTIFKKESPLPPKPQTATASASTPTAGSAPGSAQGWGSESGRERQRQARTSRQPKKEAGETAKPLKVARVDEDALAQQWAPIVQRGLAFAATAIRRATAQRMIELGLASPCQLRSLGVAY